MHWEAKTPRLLRSDFKTRTIFGQGLDWPLSFEEVEDDYRLAEREIGVSADVEDQQYLGQTFPDDYVFPMRPERKPGPVTAGSAITRIWGPG